ncbi:MAG: transglutaminase domain-containing protein [Anaerolineae bacterium]|nr:transglutaminase domain-containing protein [Anaerolineae bacterium]
MAVLGSDRGEMRGQLIYFQLLLKGALSVGKLLVTSASDVKKFRRPRATEQRYVRPPRRYDLSSYTTDMPYCQANQRYLRPTRYCNSRAPTVIALANALGAYQKSDREFAEAAFEFAKEKLTLEIAPIDGVVETLNRGTGTCFQLISVFIALCRAAGIPARYKIFATEMVQAWRGAVIDVDPLLQKWYDSLGYFLLEGEGEAYIDGRWTVAHVGPVAERQAAAGIPITRLGEDALGVWFSARPGTIMLLPIGIILIANPFETKTQQLEEIETQR